ncbi:hypothetical protein OJ998_10010 [Solirubrobacter taibaiensis]|nr:hypothetical protein [Solirubrobacter taibaiensis]
MLGEQRYEVDLVDGRAQLSDGTQFAVGLLGSAAPGPNTWLWGWANPSDYSDAVLAGAQRVQAYGQEHGIPELAEAEVALEEGVWDATRAAIAATAVAGLPAWLPVQAEGGTQVMLGIESEVPPAPPTVEPTRLGPVLSQAMSSWLIADWALALDAYAAHRGAPLRREGNTLILEPAGGDHGATIEIDDLGRITSLNMTRSATAYEPDPPKRRGLFRRKRD